MTQNSELNLVDCFVCQSNEFEQIALNQNLLDASDFHDSEHKPIGYSYCLATCKKCGHSAIKTDNPCLLPTRKYDFIKYGEPNEYYPKISKILQSLKLNYDDISIHCFSNKDFQLANFLANDLGISDINLSDYAGCSDDWLPFAPSDGSKRNPIPLDQFITERLKVSPNSNSTPSNLPVTHLVEKLIVLRQRWFEKLVKTHKLGVIGASHKGISLAQFVLSDQVQYSLHDDKEALRGKTPPVNPPLGFHLVSGFDFSEYTHIAITTTLVIAAKIIAKLRASGYTGEILDFDCQRLD